MRLLPALAEQTHVVGSNGRSQRTACLRIRNEHRLFGRKELGSFRHEVNAAENDHLRVCAGCLLSESQRISGNVRDSVKNFRRLVIVRENDSVELRLQLINSRHIRRVHGPFDVRKHTAKTVKY